MIVIFKYSNIVYLKLVSSQPFHRKIFDWTLDKSVYILRLGDNERGIMGKILKDMSGESANICQFYKKEEDAFFKNGEFCMRKKKFFSKIILWCKTQILHKNRHAHAKWHPIINLPSSWMNFIKELFSVTRNWLILAFS